MINLFRRLPWQGQIGIILVVVVVLGVAGFLALQQFQAGGSEPGESETVDVGGASQFIPQSEQPFGIIVIGEGEVLVAPDLARVVLGVEARAETAEDAINQTNAAAAKAIDAVKDVGIKDNDIQTTGVSLFPVFPRIEPAESAEPPTPSGYRSSNTITITVRNIEMTGPVVDEALAAGATSIRSIEFRLADEVQAEQKERALRLATLDAARKAHAIADALQGSVQGLISLTEEFVVVPIPQSLGRLEAARAAPTPIEAGQLRVRATVRVNFSFE